MNQTYTNDNNYLYFKVDIGGKIVCLSRNQLSRSVFVYSILQRAMRTGVKLGANWYFVERPPSEAKIVQQFCLKGYVRKPRSQCPNLFLSTLDFWHIPRALVVDEGMQQQDHLARLTPECQPEESPGSMSPHSTNSYQRALLTEYETMAHFTKTKSLRYRIWLVVENQTTSTAAKVFSYASMIFILLSLAGMIIGSIPDFQVPRANASNTTGHTRKGAGDPIAAILWVEYISIAWFSFEFLIRLFATPKLIEFMRVPLNIVDFITLVPFYMQLTLTAAGVQPEAIEDFAGIIFVLRLLRLLRVARLLKLARYSKSLKSVGASFAASTHDLLMFLILLTTGVLFFATILYFLEADSNPKMQSIPESAWFCVITMTVVGYGDVVPVTAGGQMVAAFANLAGMMVLAFPISIVVENFTIAHHEG